MLEMVMDPAQEKCYVVYIWLYATGHFSKVYLARENMEFPYLQYASQWRWLSF